MNVRSVLETRLRNARFRDGEISRAVTIQRRHFGITRERARTHAERKKNTIRRAPNATPTAYRLIKVIVVVEQARTSRVNRIHVGGRASSKLEKLEAFSEIRAHLRGTRFLLFSHRYAE